MRISTFAEEGLKAVHHSFICITMFVLLKISFKLFEVCEISYCFLQK